MGFLKKVVALVAIAALTYFTFGAGGFVATGFGSIFAAGGFVATLIGTVVIAVGTLIITTVLGLNSRAPSVADASVTTRIADAPRWINAGYARSGGAGMFGEFDSDGRFWYIIVHSDEILQSGYRILLDDEEVTLDASNYVIQKEFRLQTDSDKTPATYGGQGQGYVRIWTTTYSETDPTPPRIAALDAALPNMWTSDHRLVGTTFSVICMDALTVEHRYKIYRWRGPFGIGEPAVNIVGQWANIYDPRDATQVLGDRTTYKPSSNSALIWAWFRTHKYGRKKPESSINWDMIAAQADICDQEVVGIQGTQVRYACGTAIVDSKTRAAAEQEIMLSMDGEIVFDDDGKSWCRAGAWYEPTLTFSRNRDIMAMASMEAQDGESYTQGVIVNYIEPDANYTSQASAAWLNPIYYDPTSTPTFLTVDILTCQNHNQAMRLAKGIGMRSQPLHKIGPTVNLRGLLARQERIIVVNYDNTFAGDYEIATPVELDGTGIMTSMGCVPINSSRWTLLDGEEQPKPVIAANQTYDKFSDLPDVNNDNNGQRARVLNDPNPVYNTDWIVSVGVWVTLSSVTFPAIVGANATYADGALNVDFPAVPRDDATYVAQYIQTSAITGADNDPWVSMTINVDTATSAPVLANVDYTIRYRYAIASGAGPGWQYAVVSSNVALEPVSNLTVTGGTGSATVSWRNPTDSRFFSSDVWRGSTNVFSSATKIVSDYGGGLGQVQSITDTVSAGTWYYWIVSTDGASLDATPTGPLSGVVT